MCNPMLFMAAGAGASAIGVGNAAKAQQNSLLYDAQVSDNNAQLAEWQAQDAIHQGGLQQQAIQMQAAALKGTQRATMAANGVDLTEGTPVNVLTSTDYMEQRDVQTAQDNALRTAWGYRTQGVNYKDAASNDRAGAASINPTSSMALSLLGSAGQVSSKWYDMNKLTGSTSTGGPFTGLNDESGALFSPNGAYVRGRR